MINKHASINYVYFCMRWVIHHAHDTFRGLTPSHPHPQVDAERLLDSKAVVCGTQDDCFATQSYLSLSVKIFQFF